MHTMRGTDWHGFLTWSWPSSSCTHIGIAWWLGQDRKCWNISSRLAWMDGIRVSIWTRTIIMTGALQAITWNPTPSSMTFFSRTLFSCPCTNFSPSSRDNILSIQSLLHECFLWNYLFRFLPVHFPIFLDYWFFLRVQFSPAFTFFTSVVLWEKLVYPMITFFTE